MLADGSERLEGECRRTSAHYLLSDDGYCDLNFRRMKTLLNALSTSKDETYDGPKTGRGAGKITE
jgi:hypothetical protein